MSCHALGSLLSKRGNTLSTYRTYISWLACLGAVWSAPSFSSSMEKLEVLSAFVSPDGVCRVLLFNSGDRQVDLTLCHISSADGTPVEQIWTIAEPSEMLPAQEAAFSYFPKKSCAAATPHVLITSTGVEVPFCLSVPVLTATYSVYSPQEGLYIYIYNASENSFTINTATIANAPLNMATPVPIPAKSKGLLSGAWVPPALEYHVPPVLVRVTTFEGASFTLFTRLFSPEDTASFGPPVSRDSAECFTHSFESEQIAAEMTIRAGNEVRRTSARTARWCSIDLQRGDPGHFGQLVDRIHLEPQLAFLRDYNSGRYSRSFLSAFEKTKNAVTPGIFYCQLYPDDVQAQGSTIFPLSKIRAAAYMSLAMGAKGVELRPGLIKELPPLYQQGIARLTEELTILRPLVLLSEPVDIAHCSPETWYTCHTLLCGLHGLLLFVVPKDGVFAEENGDVEISLSPDSPDIQDVVGNEIGGGNELVFKETGGSHLKASAMLSKEVHVFYFPAKTAGTYR